MEVEERSIRLAFRVVLVLAVLVAACGRLAGGGAWGTLHEMTIARSNDPSSLNPFFESSQPDQDLTQLYVEPLVGLSSTNQLIPVVASRIPSAQNGDISRDGRTITYHLRRDERFADGVPLTSRDVAFTYRAILDRRNPVSEAQPYRIIQRLDTPNLYTVILHLRRPWAAAVATLFAETDVIYGILPAHAFNSTDVSRADWNQHPFGSGPFRVLRWDRADQIILTPNSYARRKPHLTRLVIKIVPDANTEFTLLQAHAIDVMDSMTRQQAAEAGTLPGVRVVRTDKNFIGFLILNTQRAPTNDVKIRRALVEAIDLNAIAHKVAHDSWPLATTEISPVLWAHDGSIRSPIYNPKDAARVLNGKDLEVVFSYVAGIESARSLATIVQADLAAVGVRTILRTYPSTTYFSVPNGIYYGGRFNLSWAGWYGGSDPEQSEFFTCDRRAPNGPNTTRWCNRQYDRIFLEQSVALDRRTRIIAFYKMQQMVRDAVLFVPLFYNGNFSGTNSAVRNWVPNMLYEFSNSEDWDVVPSRYHVSN
ncbi:MAG: peptide ABC transporter substrate-binding protein [Candidatus Cybelea sp.]